MTLHEVRQLVGIQVGMPRELIAIQGDISDKPWTTGFHKQPVDNVYAMHTGLAGDGQADLVHHGGPDKAICAYAIAHYPYWQAVLGEHSLPHGAFGENFTMAALDESGVCIGDTWQVGETLVVEVSQPRQPCWKLARRWQRKDLALEVQSSGKTGWYFRVIQEGEARVGDTLSLVERPRPEWTVKRANEVMHEHKDVTLAATLAAVPELSESWRATLLRRVPS